MKILFYICRFILTISFYLLLVKLFILVLNLYENLFVRVCYPD